ncbi:methionyl-tRNA formyltransferase [Tepidamorphus sp. 3E244]|uniref:methionyl-tRNA formyltransferase n=1 Tax=Tepidamorphus sp. 3E244 TaxID=3385498 RepID=UPI0038FC449A
MKALFVGMVGPIAASAIAGWIDAGNEVAVFWRPTRPLGGSGGSDRRLGRFAPRHSVAALAKSHGFDVREVPRLSAWPEALAHARALNADVLISCYFPHVVPAGMLDLYPRRAFNLHPAPLPRYRGPTPVGSMVADDTLLTDGAMTLHLMVPELDAGDIIAQAPLGLGVDDDYEGMIAACCRAARSLARGPLQAFLSGDIEAVPQDPALVTHARSTIADLTLSPRMSFAQLQLRCAMLSHYGTLEVEGINDARAGAGVVRIGDATGVPPKVSPFSLEMDSSDARVRINRLWPLRRKWTRIANRYRMIAKLRRMERSSSQND